MPNSIQKTKGKKHTKLKNKLLLAIIPVVIVIVVVMIAVSAELSRSKLSKLAQSELESSAVNQADNIVSWLNENVKEFQTTKLLIETTNPDKKTLQSIIDSTYGRNKNAPEGLYLGGSNGEFIVASNSSLQSSNPASEIWYQQGITRVDMDYGRAYKNAEGKYVISASGILDDGSSDVKVIAADLSLDKISVIVNSGVKMKKASSFLVDTSDYTILAHRDEALVSSTLGTNSGDKFLNGIAEKITQRDYEATSIENNFASFQKITGTDWILVSYVEEDVIYSHIHTVNRILILVGIIAVILLFVLIRLVVTRITSPISAITKNITSMANGDFTITIDNSSNDEIGTMSNKVSEFVESMREMISNINEEAHKLKDESDNSNAVSQIMFDASQSQESAMACLNQTVDELALAVNEIAQNATVLAGVVADTQENSQKAGVSMKETISLAEDGRSDMEQLSVAMEQILNANTQLTHSIDKVGDASEEITKIVGMISSIASQTNLLSLNASIEAARAGEAGKGFAVVASEIGNLANNSSDSANNIAQLINEVRQLINEVVMEANASQESIRANTQLIENAVKTFDAIYKNIQITNELMLAMVDDVGKVNDVASNVAAISEEQAASADEILATSEDMVDKAKSITKSSQDVATNSHELANTSETLSEYVEKFKI